MTMELAIYGKGGIGKSTLTANISAALADKDTSVLQIGCDPKHDSTRLLLGNQQLVTVLDYLKTTPPADYELSAVLKTGYGNIGCIEAGGPEPGVGCAGRGIITAFKLLDQFSVREAYDAVLYDVLGDVVCGGFAVPARREYADTIFLVSSGEFMSLYAANNILRGVRNYDAGQKRVAGILYNQRNVKDENARMAAFAQAVHLPVVATIPRNDIFTKAERANATLAALRNTDNPAYHEVEEVYEIFENLATSILQGVSHFEALPLSDQKLEEVILGAGTGAQQVFMGASGTAQSSAAQNNSLSNVAAQDDTATDIATASTRTHDGNSGNSWADTSLDSSTENISENAPERLPNSNVDRGEIYFSKNRLRSEPLHGCAFNGATTMCVHLKDVAIICHGPKSCTYLSLQTISSTGRRRLFERGTLLPVPLSPNIVSTDMDETDMVFGGTTKLLDTVQTLQQIKDGNRPKAIVIISTCTSGIIGDDIDQAKALATQDMPILTIKADGNLSGDYMQGMMDCYTQLALQVVDDTVQEQPNIVNIVFEKVVSKNTEKNFRLIEGYLKTLGVQVNCRFLCNTTYEALKNFKSASLNLLAYRDYTGLMLEDFFSKHWGCRFLDRQFPAGFEETKDWLLAVGDFFGKRQEAEAIIRKNRQRYEQGMQRVRNALQGKKLMIVTFNHDLDWILSAALDAHMEIVKICILYFSQDEGFRSRLSQIDHIEVEQDYNPAQRIEDIQRLQPDILLANYTADLDLKGTVIAENIPMCPDSGFFTGLQMLEKWADLIAADTQGAWTRDRRLLDTYRPR